MNHESEVDRLLKEDGATLTRNNKHEICKLSNGGTFVRSSTPSDLHAASAQLRDLRHALGMVRNKKDIPILKPKRVFKPKGTKPIPKIVKAKINNEMAEKLALSGALEQTLRTEIEILTGYIKSLQYQIDNCWWCRFKKWLCGFYMLST